MSLHFEATPVLRAAVGSALAAATADDAQRLKPCKKAATISLADVQLASSVLRAKRGGHPGPAWVHELLAGASPVLPAPHERAKPHPDLQPRLEKLRAAHGDREYATMVGDVYTRDSSAMRDNVEMRSYRSQMGVGLNLIVSMGTMFCVGFYAGGTAEDPRGVRATICGLALSIVAMMIEITLFVIGSSRVDKQVAKREVRAARGAGSDRTKLEANYERRDVRRRKEGKPKGVERAPIPGEAYEEFEARERHGGATEGK